MDFDIKHRLVRPSGARRMLGDRSNEKIYELLNSGELESFCDGRARYITVASIERYIAKRLAEAGAPPKISPAREPPRRRPSKKRDASATKEPPEPAPAPQHRRASRRRASTLVPA
jgi:hypothetical protein